MAIKHPLVLYGTSIQEIRAGDAIDPDLLGTSFIITPGTGLIQDSAGLSIRNISAGDAAVGSIRYNGITVAPGQFDGSATVPSSSNRLNYNGHLYATRFYGDGSNLTNLPLNITAGTGIKLTGNTISNTGVTSVNGQTGAVTLTTGSNYSAGTGINISGTTISNTGVTSVNGQTGAVTLTTGSNYSAGTGINISGTTISNTGVTSVNNATGPVSIQAGTNVTLTTIGNTITINSIGSSGSTTYTAGTGINISGTTISNSGVTSVNGQTGAVTVPVGSTYSAGTGITISGTTISNNGVTSVNNATGPVSIQAGTNVTLTTSGNTITINSTGSSGSTTYFGGTGISISGTTINNTGVTSLNSATGPVTLQAGTNVSLSTSGNTITINSTASGGTTYTGGTGISVSGSTITNTGVISVNGKTGNSITLTASDVGAVYTAGSGIGISGTTISNNGVTSVNNATGPVSIQAGTNVTLTTSGNTITINSTGSSGSTTYFGGTGISVSGSTITNTGVISVNGKTGNSITLTASDVGAVYTAGSGINIAGNMINNVGITSINSVTGPVTFQAGTNVSISRSGSTFTINSTASGGTTYTGGTGISVSGSTITNTGVTSFGGNTGAVTDVFINPNNTPSGTKLIVGAGPIPISGYWNAFFRAQPSHPAIVAQVTAPNSTNVSLYTNTYGSDFVGFYINTDLTNSGKVGAITPAANTINYYCNPGMANYTGYSVSGVPRPVIESNAVGPVFRINGGLTYKFDATELTPGTTNSISLGSSTYRFKELYASTGTINVSDERTKKDIADSDLGLNFIKQLRPVSYKFKVGTNFQKSWDTATDEEKAVGEVYTEIMTQSNPDAPGIIEKEIKMVKGSLPGVRTHYGLISQEVKQVLGVKDFAGWIISDVADPESEQGLRYEEFISPLIKAVQELSAKVEELEAKLNQQK